MHTRLAILIATAVMACIPLYADDGIETEFQGKPLSQVLEYLSGKGIQIIYSSELVTPSMKVDEDPAPATPLEMLTAVLEPHGLLIRSYNGIYVVARDGDVQVPGVEAEVLVVVRNAPASLTAEDIEVSTHPAYMRSVHHGPGVFSLHLPASGSYSFQLDVDGFRILHESVEAESGKTTIHFVELVPAQSGLEHVVVSASRYVLSSASQFYVDHQAIQAQPKLGEDPIRSAQRLPGVASDGFSSRAYFRGGLQNESSIYLNGFKLTDPFHIRDFHNMFSLIDAHAVSGIKVYTGGFPADFGDDASGILLVDTKPPVEPPHTKAGLSLFNASILNSGYSAGGGIDWLISARRSNLSDVLSDDIGEPNYSDLFASVGYNLNTDTRFTFNALIANDNVKVVTENDPEDPEWSVSRTDNDAVWIEMEKSWTSDIDSSTGLSAKRFSNRRVAVVRDPEEMIANVEDYRDVDYVALSHSMTLDVVDRHSLRWGLEFSRQSADYQYLGTAEYFGIAAKYPGFESPKRYQTKVQPSGNVIGLFVADQVELGEQLSIDIGLRWDKQTYTTPGHESQISPRASLLYVTGQGNEFRLSVGRFHQSERIHELQVENNVDRFYRPKRVDQFIASYQWKLRQSYQFRAEAYYKDYGREIPRSENLFDQLQMVPEFQPDRVRLEPESARATGLELSVDYIGSETLSWYLSYALSRAVDVIDGRTESRSWDQTHAIQAGLVWQSGGWEIGAAFQAHTGWPTTGLMLIDDPASGMILPVPGPRNEERFGTYASFDFRVGKSFDVKKGELSVFLEVLNATNRKNSCCVDYGIEENPDGNPVFQKNVQYWLPIIPSIGLNWQF